MAAIIRKPERTVVEQAVNPVGVKAPTTGLEKLGAGLADVGDMFNQWQDEVDTADAKAADSAFSDLIRQELYGDDAGFMYSEGGDAVNRRGTVSERIEQEQKRILEEMSPGARARAKSAMDARAQRALMSIDQHTSGQRKTYLDTAADARVASATQDAIYDPDLVAQSIATSRSEILDMADRNGWAPEVTAQKLRESETAVYSGVIERLSNVSPVQALKYLRENKKHMEGAEVARLEGALIPLVREHRGRQAGRLAAMSGVSDTYLSAIRAAESGGDDAAENPASTATGRYQFIKDTWAGLMKRHPELGLTADGRLDAEQQERAIRAFTRENADVLQRNGFAPTNGNLYAAHFLGAGGAVRVLGADDGALMSSLVSEQVLDANPFLTEMTVADFRAWSSRKGGGNEIGFSPQAGGVESLLEITDPDERAAAIREYKLVVGVRAKQVEAARQKSEDAAFQMIESGGSIDDLPLSFRQSIGREAMNSLRVYQERIASGTPVRTVDAFYVQLADMAARSPEEFMRTDPMTWRDKLDDGDFQFFVKRRADLVAGRRDAGLTGPSLSALRTAASTALKAAGVDGKDKLEAEFERSLLQWATRVSEAEGRDPSALEINTRINEMLVPVVIDPKGLRNKQSGSAFEMDYDGKAYDPNDDITPAMLRNGALTINKVSVSNEMMEIFATGFEARFGRAPTVQELVEGMIASGVYDE